MRSVAAIPSHAWRKLEDPSVSAQAVGLRYLSDQNPGIRREGTGKAFRYRFASGQLVSETEVLKRIKSLAIPPAWTDVWISPDPCGHLQATGRDARRRKQYRYHPRWREIRDETKYTRMIGFAKALSRIRRQLKKDLALHGLPKRRILATVVRLLELSLIRVGNEEYERENETFGLTTMKSRHVKVNGESFRFEFRGKGNKWHRVDIHDRRLAKIIKKCHDLPGQELFQYVDEEGRRQNIKSTDVNEYLSEISGQDFTAKDFRTWAGTVLTGMALGNFEGSGSTLAGKKNVTRAIHFVAERLGNTPAICRRCYVHPDVIAAYLDGGLPRRLRRAPGQGLIGSVSGLSAVEVAVLRLLERRLAAREKPLAQQLAASLVRQRRRNRSR